MLPIRVKGLVPLLFALTGVATAIQEAWAQKSGGEFRPMIPKTWDDAAMAALEIPLADPVGSPRHAPADYYYKMPVRPIYKQYPVYAPGVVTRCCRALDRHINRRRAARGRADIDINDATSPVAEQLRACWVARGTPVPCGGVASDVDAAAGRGRRIDV